MAVLSLNATNNTWVLVSDTLHHKALILILIYSSEFELLGLRKDAIEEARTRCSDVLKHSGQLGIGATKSVG